MSLESEWERCSPWLQAALDRAGNTHSLDDVFALVKDPRCMTHFWPGEAAAAVTEFVVYPRMVALNVWLGGGKLADLMGLQAPIEAFAREMGCARVQGTGRPGFERTLDGYRPLAVMYVKDLERTLQ